MTPHTKLAAVAALAFAALVGTVPAHAQNAVTGKLLFEDTPNASGINTLTGSCTSCHGSVENRRIKIAGDRYAEISLATATERFRLAIASVGPMAQFDALSVEQVQNIAAYLADTPRRSVDRLDLTAAAINAPGPSQSVDLRHAVATTESLHVMSVAVSGAGATRFTRSADSCDQQTLAPGASCRVTVGYAAPDTAGAAASLTFTLRQGTSTSDFTRVVALSGAVATTTPPPPVASGTDTGGGALGLGWLAGLAASCVALMRTRRHQTPSSTRKPLELPCDSPSP
jgi:mono/diheme cytochrome c family protein